jgi:hypothetical protein
LRADLILDFGGIIAQIINWNGTGGRGFSRNSKFISGSLAYTMANIPLKSEYEKLIRMNHDEFLEDWRKHVSNRLDSAVLRNETGVRRKKARTSSL